MILHVPHGSRHIPPDLRRTILLDDADLERELLLMTDAWTGELYAREDAEAVVFPVSRLVVDPERFTDDSLEPMAAKGMGAVYTRTSDGWLLRQDPSAGERDALLERFYRPHHEALEAAVDGELRKRGRSLLIDCHSFPARPLPSDLDRSEPRPDFCIGTDPFHTPRELEEAAVETLSSRGYQVEVNRPYRGTLVPGRHFRVDPAVSSLMIEIRRDLYMDEETGRKGEGFEAMRGLLAAVTGRLQLVHDSHGRVRQP